MQEFLRNKKHQRSRGLFRKCHEYQLVEYDANITPPDIAYQQGVGEIFKKRRVRSVDTAELVGTELILYAGEVECEDGCTGEKRRGFVSRPSDEEKRIETPAGRYGSPYFKEYEEYNE
jgi:hypothetical protein